MSSTMYGATLDSYSHAHWSMYLSMYVHRYPDVPRRGAAQGTGMRGVNREFQDITLGHDFLRFPQRPRYLGCCSPSPCPC